MTARKIPPPPVYPPMIKFRILKHGKTYTVEVPSKYADHPAPWDVVTIGMLHGGVVALK